MWGAKVKAAYKSLHKSMHSEAKVGIAPYAKLILARVQEKIRHDKSFDQREYRELPGLEMKEANENLVEKKTSNEGGKAT